VGLIQFPNPGDFACHTYHWPSPEDVDLHHVVPRAWQAFWRPGSPVTGHPFPHSMAALSDSALWHPETARVPPTCHRSVHNRIVLIMKATYSSVSITGASEVERFESALAQVPHRGKLWDIALRAPRAWLEVGGSLDALAKAKLWGES
jgi:hypothetical protein